MLNIVVLGGLQGLEYDVLEKIKGSFHCFSLFKGNTKFSIQILDDLNAKLKTIKFCERVDSESATYLKKQFQDYIAEKMSFMLNNDMCSRADVREQITKIQEIIDEEE